MNWYKIGEVVHYFGKINVAVIELEDALEVGDWIAFVKDDNLLFEQEVTSMQIDYQNLTEAYAGDTIGLEVEQAVKVGLEVYKGIEDTE